MINFRYHVVSLTAVFLALAIGLVVGTTALNGPIADSLKEKVDQLGKQNQELRDRMNHLQEDVDRKEDFADQAAPTLLAHKLTAARVLLVTLPSGAGYAEGVSKMLTTAGATITGQVDIKDKFLDPARNDELLDLAHERLPRSVNGTLPTNTDGVEASSALLAAVLLDRTPAVTSEDLTTVIAAYESQDYIGIAGDDVSRPAQAVVIISGPPDADKDSARKNGAVLTMVDQFDQAGRVVFFGGPPDADKDSARKNGAVLTMVDQFDQAGRVVVAANGVAGDGNVVAAVRADPKLKQNVSTVDNVSTPQGRLVTALAVADQMVGTTAHYGIGDGASLLPKSTQ